MNIIHDIDNIKKRIKEYKKDELSIGFVPTMGYLHKGHESLIKKACIENDKVVVSVFVNPIQFGVNEDLSNYPNDIKKDIDICEKLGVDIVFNPEAKTMYNEDFSTFIEVENLTKGLCGKSRPTHFKGVCTVVNKLFNIVNPDRAYFGQKDAQQLAVIKKMVRDLNMNIEIIGCPIIREKDGLAKSSRNTYLTIEERKAATIINKTLNEAKKLIVEGERNSENIINFIKNEITLEPLAKIDYIDIVDINRLEDIKTIEHEVLVAIAVFIGKTRLIDNFIYDEI
ncbi:pantoate--beta-alanine ligase [Paraclostridium sordellii]|uniref:pantoate--beta-alanine ligase n=1 Tax=Paraclostridium sordellii TaxID=1505 RepID=UPI0005DD5570|nr:pantoate--beta-alanine ligase [Paeniclostridium sordellii]CEO21476.1 pantoate--beta-alanine ligase [[Clostridium] sordellii] [Paeniclostridium sordellii]